MNDDDLYIKFKEVLETWRNCPNGVGAAKIAILKKLLEDI